MKLIKFLFLLSFISLNGFSQDLIYWRFGGSYVNFEDPIEYKLVKIDTSKIWHICKPQKQILFIPSNHPFLQQFAIVSDSNAHYQTNLKSSFQFKLYIENGVDGYSLSFFQKFDFEQNKDGGIIETSYDNGLSWNNILFDSLINQNLDYTENIFNKNDTIAAYGNQPGFTGLKSEIEKVTITFRRDERMVDDTMLLRFTIVSDSVNSFNEGWMIDHITFGSYIVGIEQMNLNNPDFLVFPNPSNGRIEIGSEAIKIEKVDVLNSAGLILNTVTNSNTLDLKDYPPGIYVLRLNNKYFKKIIIE